MSRANDVPWLLWKGGLGDPSGDWECLHCGRFGGLPWGCSFDVLIATLNALGREHRGCPKPQDAPTRPEDKK